LNSDYKIKADCKTFEITVRSNLMNDKKVSLRILENDICKENVDAIAVP